MQVEQQSRRPAMIRNLIRYGAYKPEALAGLSDRQIEELADRLKHCLVVGDKAYHVIGMQTG